MNKTVNIRGKGERTAPNVVRLRHLSNLKQFCVGEFDPRLVEADLAWLESAVEDLMLLRNDGATKKLFYVAARLPKKQSVHFTRTHTRTPYGHPR